MTVNIQKRKSYKIRNIHRVRSGNGISPARKLYILLTFIAAAGAFMGAYSCIMTETVLSSDISRSFTEELLRSTIPVTAYIFICFFAGYSSVGQPAGYFICLFKGMGAGFLSVSAMRGNVYSPACIAAILISEAVSMVAVILAARENIRMSTLTAERTFGRSDNCPCGALKLYIVKFVIILLIGALSASVRALYTVL